MTKYYITEEGVKDITDLLNKTDETITLLVETVNILKKSLEESEKLPSELKTALSNKSSLDVIETKRAVREEAAAIRSHIDGLGKKFENSVNIEMEERMNKIRQAILLITKEIEKIKINGSVDEKLEKHMHGITTVLSELEVINEAVREVKERMDRNKTEMEEKVNQIGKIKPDTKVSGQVSSLKTELKKMNEMLSLSVDIKQLIDMLDKSHKKVTAIEMKKPPAWLRKDNRNATKSVRTTVDMLAEVAVARLLTAEMNASELMKRSPVSQDKTRKILNTFVRQKRIKKRKKGRQVFYSLR